MTIATRNPKTASAKAAAATQTPAEQAVATTKAVKTRNAKPAPLKASDIIIELPAEKVTLSNVFDKLNPLLIKAIVESGYDTPTAIQAAAIPLALKGRDIMASAQTGTGKTAAFILPALEKLAAAERPQGRGPRVLVLAPTRELAMQVKTAAEKYAKHMRQVRVVSILGGMSYHIQHKQLSQPIDILVATPGRLIDHMERGRIDFSRLEMLILDEADRMLDMGFSDDVDHIVAATPESRQTLLFSATFEGEVTRLAQRLLKNPERISIATQQAKHSQIEQRIYYVDDMSHKNRLLSHLLADTAVTQAIIFTATKRSADELSDTLYDQGYAASALHGDMQQGARTRTITRLRQGTIKILVATDVAARGIDVAGISHVFNYDLPMAAEDYVHRIGRTGRAGAFGNAISFVSPKDGFLLKRIERFTGSTITVSVVEGMEARRKPQANTMSNNRRPSGNNGQRQRTFQGRSARNGSSPSAGGGYRGGEQSRSRSNGSNGGSTSGGRNSRYGSDTAYEGRERSSESNSSYYAANTGGGAKRSNQATPLVTSRKRRNNNSGGYNQANKSY